MSLVKRIVKSLIIRYGVYTNILVGQLPLGSFVVCILWGDRLKNAHMQ